MTVIPVRAGIGLQPRKRESSAVSGALALGARFRGHDENVGDSFYVNFCNDVLGQARRNLGPKALAAFWSDRAEFPSVKSGLAGGRGAQNLTRAFHAGQHYFVDFAFADIRQLSNMAPGFDDVLRRCRFPGITCDLIDAI
jgi:hypothetical protein